MTPSPFTHYDPAVHSPSDVVALLLGPSPGFGVLAESIQITAGSNATATGRALSFYDGSLTALGIGAGLLLTSGDASPPLSNTRSNYGFPLTPSATDASLTAVIEAAFPAAGAVRDATILQFQFLVIDPTLASIRFDLVFGSDEFPEYSGTQFVDIAGVFVNDVNYALFNAEPTQPLSVLNQNLTAGNFINNVAGILPIEYDGVSDKLTIVAPIVQGVNTLKIAISDTGDQIFDSGLFIANLHAVPYVGAGLAHEVVGTDGNDILFSKNFNQVFDLGAGVDVLIVSGAGNDVIKGGDGVDYVIYSGSLGKPQGPTGNSVLTSSVLTSTDFGWTMVGPGGNDTFYGVERIHFSDSGLFALDTKPGGNAWFVYALTQALTNAAPSTTLLSRWTAEADRVGGDFDVLTQHVLDYYIPGLPLEVLVGHMFHTIAGITPTPDQLAEFTGLVGPGDVFETAGALVAWVAELDLNTVEIAAIVGQPLQLDSAYFVA